MPELPEVEVVRRGLARYLSDARIRTVDVYHPRSVRGQDGSLPELLSGSVLRTPQRRGKYLWFPLDDGRHSLFVHLGMSGQMLFGAPGEVTSPHLRIRAVVETAEGEEKQLSFVDQRTFGRWLWAPMVEGVPLPVQHIARDLFDEHCDDVAIARKIRSKRSEIKRVLLDQRVVSGIGNIYADESLWAAGITPWRRAYRLRLRDTLRLLECTREVMGRALAAGGTSFDSLYVNVDGASGYFARSLAVYGRAGEPCPRCGGLIERVAWTNRSTHWCPRCQRL